MVIGCFLSFMENQAEELPNLVFYFLKTFLKADFNNYICYN